MPKLIDSQLVYFYVLGDPISHSLSPVIQNRILAELKVDGIYLPIRVKKHEVESFFQFMVQEGNTKGCNITLPLKEKSMFYVRQIDPIARKIGAINTVVLKEGQLVGFNTDAFGFGTSLIRDCRFDPREKIALVYGAGGSSQAVIYSLAQMEINKIWICNRTKSRAKKIIDKFQKLFPTLRFSFCDYNLKKVSQIISDCQIVINTTSVNCCLDKTTVQKFPFPSKNISPQTVLFDLNYPKEKMIWNHFVEIPKYDGVVMDGLGMLIYQAIRSMELWLEQEIPIDNTEKKIKSEILKKHPPMV